MRFNEGDPVHHDSVPPASSTPSKQPSGTTTPVTDGGPRRPSPRRVPARPHSATRRRGASQLHKRWEDAPVPQPSPIPAPLPTPLPRAPTAAGRVNSNHHHVQELHRLDAELAKEEARYQMYATPCALCAVHAPQAITMLIGLCTWACRERFLAVAAASMRGVSTGVVPPAATGGDHSSPPADEAERVCGSDATSYASLRDARRRQRRAREEAWNRQQQRQQQVLARKAAKLKQQKKGGMPRSDHGVVQSHSHSSDHDTGADSVDHSDQQSALSDGHDDSDDSSGLSVGSAGAQQSWLDAPPRAVRTNHNTHTGGAARVPAAATLTPERIAEEPLCMEGGASLLEQLIRVRELLVTPEAWE